MADIIEPLITPLILIITLTFGGVEVVPRLTIGRSFATVVQHVCSWLLQPIQIRHYLLLAILVSRP